MKIEMPEIGKREWSFIVALGKERLTLSEIQKKINPKNEVYEAQRIFNKLQKAGMLETFKESHKRYVQLNANGIYFLEFYNRMEKKQ